MNNWKLILATLLALLAGQTPLFAQPKTTRIIVVQDSSKRSETEQVWIDYAQSVKAWADSVNRKLISADLPPLPQFPEEARPDNIDIRKEVRGDSVFIRVEIDQIEADQVEIPVQIEEREAESIPAAPNNFDAQIAEILKQENLLNTEIVKKQITKSWDPATKTWTTVSELHTEDGEVVTIRLVKNGVTENLYVTRSKESAAAAEIPAEVAQTLKDHKLKNRYTESFLSTGIGTGYVFNGTSLLKPLPAPGQMPELTPISTNVNFDMMRGWSARKGKVWLYSGLAYNYQTFQFNDRTLTISDQSEEFTAVSIGSDDVKRSSLETNWVGIPLALAFQSEPVDPDFQILVGACGFYNVRNQTEIKFKNGSKSKTVGDFNINDWAWSPFVQVKFDGFGVYARYHMSNLFKPNDMGYSANLLQFGLVLN
jgi:hypothetical protein